MSDINAFSWLFTKRRPVFSPVNVATETVSVVYVDGDGNVIVDGSGNVCVDGQGTAQIAAFDLIRYV